ncbi:IS630 family transposase [Neisseria bacilliformis ATCC BAA-1200]|uniref:IS630 family transposase n=1 Tax=Neisseria bacilliformis ATCC BAA-1200 TaxID=888742 RepID=F2B954_9NEIS|nr:IS630 family transposase [Neisseria bacilliformis ATCC BAA-1200]
MRRLGETHPAADSTCAGRETGRLKTVKQLFRRPLPLKQGVWRSHARGFRLSAQQKRVAAERRTPPKRHRPSPPARE